MAFTITQQFPFTDHEGWWRLKEALVAGGATVKSSSDGTTFGAGDQLSPGGPYPQSGAGSFGNTDAWMVLQFPTVAGVTREIMFQLGSLTGRIRMYYSSDGAGFSGGGATAAPTAADQQFLQNEADNVFQTSNPQYHETTFFVGDADEGYSFLMETRYWGSIGVIACVFMDVVKNPVAGDPDPCVVCCAPEEGVPCYRYNSNLFVRTIVNTTSTNCAGWFDKGGPNEAWVAYPFCVPGYFEASLSSSSKWHRDTTNKLFPNLQGNHWMMPITYMRGEDLFGATALGYKGISRFFRITSESAAEGSMLRSADGRLHCTDGVVRPWDPQLPKRWK